jgi:arsenate reductase
MKDNLDDLSLDQQHLVRTVTARLEPLWAGTFGPETIERFVHDSLDRLLPTATVTTFLPVLAEKFAKERLNALARLESTVPAAVPGVLFLCVHNAGRSQMAAGWLRHLAGDRVVVWSGGSEPNSEINAAAIEAMAEVGIDITDEFPKPWTDEIVRPASV